MQEDGHSRMGGSDVADILACEVLLYFRTLHVCRVRSEWACSGTSCFRRSLPRSEGRRNRQKLSSSSTVALFEGTLVIAAFGSRLFEMHSTRAQETHSTDTRLFATIRGRTAYIGCGSSQWTYRIIHQRMFQSPRILVLTQIPSPEAPRHCTKCPKSIIKYKRLWDTVQASNAHISAVIDRIGTL